MSSTVTLPITGMSCAACSSYLERTLTEVPGVDSAVVSLLAGQAVITGSVPPERLIEVVQEAGYDAAPPAGDDAGTIPEETETHLPLRAGLALGAAALSMGLSMNGMNIPGRGPQPARWVLLVVAAIVMLFLSPETYRRALAAARHRTTNMSTLVAVGTLTAFFWSSLATVAPRVLLRHGVEPTVYFEAVDFILAFLLLGAWLDARAKQQTRSELEAFAALAPAAARVVRHGVEVEVPVAEVQHGDHVLLRPGERIPVDGKVISGASTVDESLLTGEAMPVLKEAASTVSAGTLNLDGPLTVEATTVGAASTLAQLRRLLSEAQSSHAPMQKLADQASAVFVPVVLGMAALTFVTWLALARSLPQAISAAVAVLVIACPCAMGLAVPAALTVGLGRAARMGMLIKSGEVLERLARTRSLAFDKTGTLTEGRPSILSTTFAAELPAGRQAQILALAAALERGSEHPLARAVEVYVGQQTQALPQIELSDVRTIPGQGVAALWQDHPVAIGNAKLTGVLEEAATGAASSLYLIVDGTLVLTLTAQDTLRPSAQGALRELAAQGISTHMLTGDTRTAAAQIARQAGIVDAYVHAGLLPAGKLALIRKLQQQAPTAMAGDGLNDAAALAAAETGITLAGTGTDLAREASGVVLLHPDLSRIPLVIRLARQTTRVMRQNLGWAIGYNALGLPIAAGVLYPHFHILLSPVLASAAMALSSTSVLFNSLRLRRFT